MTSDDTPCSEEVTSDDVPCLGEATSDDIPNTPCPAAELTAEDVFSPDDQGGSDSGTSAHKELLSSDELDRESLVRGTVNCRTEDRSFST